jgi:predicted RNase H-like HicB family nuclease
MKYTAIFKKEDLGYSVFFPALQGCITKGDSREEAISNATEALSFMIETQISINPSFELPEDIGKSDYELEDGEFTQLIEFKISPAGDRWEDFRKEKYLPEERVILDKEVEKHITIKQRFADYDQQYEPIDIDWGEDVGAEILDDK